MQKLKSNIHSDLGEQNSTKYPLKNSHGNSTVEVYTYPGNNAPTRYYRKTNKNLSVKNGSHFIDLLANEVS